MQQKKISVTDYKRWKISFINLTSSKISKKTKIRLLQSNVLSVLLCGAECWKITQKDNQWLSGFHSKCLRKICKIYLPRKTPNKDLDDWAASPGKKISPSQTQPWYGHQQKEIEAGDDQETIGEGLQRETYRRWDRPGKKWRKDSYGQTQMKGSGISLMCYWARRG